MSAFAVVPRRCPREAANPGRSARAVNCRGWRWRPLLERKSDPSDGPVRQAGLDRDAAVAAAVARSADSLFAGHPASARVGSSFLEAPLRLLSLMPHQTRVARLAEEG